MKTLTPDGRIEGARATRFLHTLPHKVSTLSQQVPFEPPGDLTTIWRDGEVVRQSPGKRARVMPSVNPILP